MGPSGSGKSTLLTIAGTLEEPTSGEVLVGGSALSSHVAQRPGPAAAALDRLRVPGLQPARRADRGRERGAAAGARRRRRQGGPRRRRWRRSSELGLADRADRFPDELSGGERQRVAIARAVVGDRRLLLADEPTGALDSVNGEAVMRLLRAACQRGVAGVVVTHDAQLASWADRVVFLRDGRVVDQTAPPPGPESLLAPAEPMSACTGRAETGGRGAARRAVVRWAWRLFRREWRQQLLVLALLTVAVAAAIGSASGAPTTSPRRATPSSARPTIASSSTASDPAALATPTSRRPRRGSAPIEVIGHRTVAGAGLGRHRRARAQDPTAPSARRCCGLRRAATRPARARSRSPTAVAATFQVGVGGTLDLGRPDADRRRLVENPATSTTSSPSCRRRTPSRRTSVTILRRPPSAPSPSRSAQPRRAPAGACSPTTAARPSARPPPSRVLVARHGRPAARRASSPRPASSSIAQRRLRQLGHARRDRRHRAAPAPGDAGQRRRRRRRRRGGRRPLVGARGWIAVAPRLETRRRAPHRPVRPALVAHRRRHAAGASSPRPRPRGGRPGPPRGSRSPQALSARPPRPEPAHRSAAAAGLLVASAWPASPSASTPTRTRPTRRCSSPAPWRSSSGPAARPARRSGPWPPARTAAGRGPAGPARPRPLPGPLRRGAGRDQPRSASRWPSSSPRPPPSTPPTRATCPTASSDPHRRRRGPLVPDRTPAELASLRAAVDRLAATLDATAGRRPRRGRRPDRSRRPRRPGARPRSSLGRPVGETTAPRHRRRSTSPPRSCSATSGSTPPRSTADTDVLTPHDRRVALRQPGRPQRGRAGRRRLAPSSRRSTSPPTPRCRTRCSPRGACGGAGGSAAPAGWLVEARSPLTSAQLAHARDLAADAGLTIESRDTSATLTAVRTGATAAGVLLALGVLAMTVGLIRSEAAGDLRTLTATGATSRHPPHPHRRHRRRARPARRPPRHRRRLPRPGRRLPRRPGALSPGPGRRTSSSSPSASR